MKRTIKLLALAAMLTVFAAPVLAQSKECNDENKAAWYDTFLKNYKGEAPQQKVAYDAAKLYLACPNAPDDKIPEFLNKFVTAYDKLTGDQTIKKQFDDAFKQKNYADEIRLGKQIVATEPDNSAVYVIMGLAGLGDPALLSESTQYAKKAIELIEAGKPFAPYTSKDQALAALNYVVAKANLKNALADAIPYLLKAARYESDLKKNPQLYLDLAAAYNDGPRARLSEAYKIYLDKPETPDSKLALANINQVIDRQIDALARAAALATGGDKKLIMDELTEIYKYRNKSDTGLNELVASVLSKPIPDVPMPLTSLPATTPSSTPASTGSPGTNGSTTGGTASGTKSGTTTGASSSGQNKTSTTGTVNGSAKPGPSPTPSNKKPR